MNALNVRIIIKRILCSVGRSIGLVNWKAINSGIDKEKPRELALIGVYSLTRSNPATKCAPCIKSMIVCCHPSAYSFHRLPSGVLDLILICQHSSLARVTCSLSGVLYIILMFSPFLVQRCPLSSLVVTILVTIASIQCPFRYPCRLFILSNRIFILKITKSVVFPVPCQHPSDTFNITHSLLIGNGAPANF